MKNNKKIWIYEFFMFLKNNELIVLHNIDKNIKLKNNDHIF